VKVKTRSHGLLKVRGIEAGRRDVVITLDEGIRATITVVDDEGRPVAGATVGAANDDGSRAQGAWTDARGIALLTGLPEDEVLDLRVGTDEDDLQGTTIEGWLPADTTVRLPAKRLVSGVVVDPEGRPVPRVDVGVSPGQSCLPAKTDSHGRFRLLVDEPGEITVRITDGEHMLVEAPFRGEPLLLVLDPGLDLTVHVEGWVRSALYTTTAALVALGSPAAHVREAPVEASGTARFERLRRDTVYALWIPPQADGRALLLRDVHPAAGPLRVTLREGRSIRGKALAPAGTEMSVQAHLEDHEDIAVHGTLGGDGTYEIAGLPDGRWIVRLATVVKGRMLFPEAVVEAGGTHDFDLTQER
jgi:hypothetical protein